MNPDVLAHRNKIIKSCSCLNPIACSSSHETFLPGTLKNYNMFCDLQLELTLKSTLSAHVLELGIRSVLMAFLQEQKSSCISKNAENNHIFIPQWGWQAAN